MWGRGVVVENEMMFHAAQGCGPVDQRRPVGLAINSTISADPAVSSGWRIMTGGDVVSKIPENEFRLLIHWGAQVYSDLAELKLARDHSDDITVDMALNILVSDLRARGEIFEMPTDPVRDTNFITLLTRVYDIGRPKNVPEDPVAPRLVA